MKAKKVNSNNENQKDDYLFDNLIRNGNGSQENETKPDSNKTNQVIENLSPVDTNPKRGKNDIKKKSQEKGNNVINNRSNPDEDNNSRENSEYSSDSFSSSEDVESLRQKQLMICNERAKEIIITKKESEDIIPLDEAKDLLNKKDYESLLTIKFPYLRQGEFNSQIYKTDLRIFRKLIFSCPVCAKGFRNYSLPYHIFQNHFDQINKYLTEKEIAQCCAKLLKIEKEKLELSLDIFSDLALLFNKCKFSGASQWREITEESILKIKKLNIEKIYFNKSQKDIANNLTKILPINKNKNSKRKYKKIKK